MAKVNTIFVMKYGMKIKGLSPTKLRQKIDDSGLTQLFIAEQAGIPATNLSRILRGKFTNVRVALAAAIADVLECNIEDILE